MTNEAYGDISQRVQYTLNDATNLYDGADNAAARLQNDVYQNYRQLGGGQAYSIYLDSVTASMTANTNFGEVAAAWTSHNTQRFDMNGDGRLDQGEINAAIHRSGDPLEKQMLVSVRDQYQNIKHAGGEGFLGIRPNSLETNDFAHFAADNQAERNQVAAQNLQQEHSRYLMRPLLATADGDPRHSLFSVLDNATGGAKDGQVSKHDLESFVRQYDRAAFNGGDTNQGTFTRGNRDFVQQLAHNWDTPEVVALRTRTSVDAYGQVNVDKQSRMTLDSLQSAGGFDYNSNLFQNFKIPQPAPCGPSPAELARARDNFQQQLQAHIEMEAHYRAKPGQGFDAVARDVIKIHSNDNSYTNEQNVVTFSDHIARMNGRSGRLDTRVVLRGENLTVFDDQWVQKQIQARMVMFDRSMARMQAGRQDTGCIDQPQYPAGGQ